MKKHKNGFTLAEVLITLVIIGIIAAMTIPTLMNKTNEQETVVAVKKAYSTLSQAYQRMIAENGEIYPENLGSTIEEATENFGDMFAKQLNVQKNCGLSSDEECWRKDYKLFNNSDWSLMDDYLIRLQDGSSVRIAGYFYYSPKGESEQLSTVYGAFQYDVNGDKGPNIRGKDTFSFWLTKYGVIPCGMPDDTGAPLSNCRRNGVSCTAWVLTKGNMDYLRKEVSW